MISERIFSDIDKEITVRGHSKNTGTAYKTAWKHIREYFVEADHPKNISTNQFKDFFQFISETISPSTMEMCFNAAKYYYDNIEGQKHKFDGIKIKHHHSKIPDIVEHETIMKVIDECTNPHDKAIIATFYGTGARLTELITLKKEDICRDGEKSFIHIRHGKGDKPRIVPLRPEVLEIIDEHLAQLPQYKRFSRFLFAGEKPDHYISQSTAQRIVDRNFTEKHVHPHMLRHSLGTWLYEQGVHLKTIATIFGHSSTRTTEIYTHVRPKFLLDTVNPFDKSKNAISNVV